MGDFHDRLAAMLSKEAADAAAGTAVAMLDNT